MPVNYLVKELRDHSLKAEIPKQTKKMDETEIKRQLGEMGKTVLRLAFCDASAQILNEFAQRSIQAAAEVDCEMIAQIKVTLLGPTVFKYSKSSKYSKHFKYSKYSEYSKYSTPTCNLFL